MGKISFDGKEIKNNEEFSVTNLGHVPQNIYLIDSSIKGKLHSVFKVKKSIVLS